MDATGFVVASGATAGVLRGLASVGIETALPSNVGGGVIPGAC